LTNQLRMVGKPSFNGLKKFRLFNLSKFDPVRFWAIKFLTGIFI
jgi:hypothetical protein